MDVATGSSTFKYPPPLAWQLNRCAFPARIEAMQLLFLFSAIVATQPIPDPSAKIFLGNEYPKVAFDNGWQADVAVDLTVGRDGRVNACTVTRSSDHQLLDEATCKLMTVRARFKPATDTSGNPTKGYYQTHLNWRIAH
jgi:TonB family protein